MTRLLKWFYMLAKRLYKKAAFVMLMVLLIAAVIVFTISSKSDSGFLRIALAEEEQGGKISSDIIEELLNEDSMILFTRYDSPAAAIDSVAGGSADAAWIFPANMGDTVGDYSLLKGDTVKVVERQQNVITRLAREKLNAVLFSRTAKAFYLGYADEKLPMLDSFSDEELLQYFRDAKIDEELFVFDNPTSGDIGSTDYLTAPLRGLLGIITLLGGMAGALYYMKDEERKLFETVEARRRPLVAFGCIFTAAVNIAVVSMIALVSSGLYRFSISEVIATLLYAVAVTAFCMLLGSIFRNIKLFCAALPALIIIISVVCPVFFNLKQVRGLSFLFPPTYYINAPLGGSYLLYLALFSAACLLLTFVLDKIIRKRA